MASPRIIPITDPHRRKHFDFFRQMDQPHFSLTANVDISVFLTNYKQSRLPFTPCLVYVLSRAANELPPFRQRIRGENIVEHDAVSPSYTVPTKNSEVFSFCQVAYQHDAKAFAQSAQLLTQKRWDEPIFEDEEGRDDLLFLSAIPWVSFTGLTHAMQYHPVDSVPRISWGRYFQQGDKWLIPLAVQAHHALVDGRHMGQYFTQVQDLLDNSSSFFH